MSGVFSFEGVWKSLVQPIGASGRPFSGAGVIRLRIGGQLPLMRPRGGKVLRLHGGGELPLYFKGLELNMITSFALLFDCTATTPCVR